MIDKEFLIKKSIQDKNADDESTETHHKRDTVLVLNSPNTAQRKNLSMSTPVFDDLHVSIGQ